MSSQGMSATRLTREMPAPSRGLVGNLFAVLFQPKAFFKRFPAGSQWMWAALVILLLIGIAAVRVPAPADPNALPPADVFVPPTGDIPFDPNSVAIPPGALNGIADTPTTDLSQTLITALLAAGGIMIGWLIQMLLLAQVSMFNQAVPRFSRNLRIAVWASAPLALLAIIQMVYFGFGGQPVEQGANALLADWQGYAELPTFYQAWLHSLSSKATLFWVWNFILLFVGARRALYGKWWSATLVVVLWIALATLIPVLTGAVEPYTLASNGDNIDVPSSESFIPQEGEIIPQDGGGSFEVVPERPNVEIVPGS
jgi:hypothetical protein